MNTVLRSKPGNVVLVKFWVPLLFGGISVAMCSGALFTRALFLASPFILGTLFFSSLAVLKIEGGTLRYRRFLSWKEIPFGNIVSARIEAPPVIASLRCRKWLFPWGRLYFVLDGNMASNPFREGEYPLINYIRNHISRDVAEPGQAQSQALRQQGAKLGLAVMSGAIFQLVSTMLARHLASSLPAEPHHPLSGLPLLAQVHRVTDVLALFQVQVSLAILFALLAIYRRRHQDGWIYAFLTGVALPYIVLH